MLELRNVDKFYEFKKHWYLKKERLELFKNLNFILKKGQNLAIFGASGSGKSTLARILCFLEKPSLGEVLYENINLHTLNFKEQRKLRKEIQYLFQDQKLALNPYKRVKNLIFDVYGNFGLKKDKEKIASLFEEFELKEQILNQKPYNLSGGEAARIGLIRTLILEPKLLILDELTSSLDSFNAFKIMNFLKKYQEKKELSFIFITHQKEFLKNFDYQILKL